MTSLFHQNNVGGKTVRWIMEFLASTLSLELLVLTATAPVVAIPVPEYESACHFLPLSHR